MDVVEEVIRAHSPEKRAIIFVPFIRPSSCPLCCGDGLQFLIVATSYAVS
jgi:hypothetical protein